MCTEFGHRLCRVPPKGAVRSPETRRSPEGNSGIGLPSPGADDGETEEFGPGDFTRVEPGHDAWVLGDESCVVLDWVGFGDYAKPA